MIYYYQTIRLFIIKTDLANAVDVSRDIIGKYELGEHSPSIEITTKLAEVLEVSVDYMLGRKRFRKYDKEAIMGLEGIQKMDDDTKNKLFDIIDTYIRDSKAKAAYGF